MLFNKYEDKEYKQINQNFSYELNKYLYNEKLKNDYFEIVFLCIGTDRLIGDCFGPLVGSKLKELLDEKNIYNITIYGTLNKNICYTNIDKAIKKINKEHPKACIIVIDAALSKESNIGKIYVQNKKMEIAKGLCKEKYEVGDISIKAVVGKDHKISKYNFFSMQNIPLSMVISLSNIVAEGIYEVIKYA